MINKSIAEGFEFAFSSKRMLPYILLNFLLLFSISDMFGRIGSLTTLSSEEIEPLAPFVAFYILVFVVYIFSQPLLLGAMVHQAKFFPKKKAIKESFKFSLSIYPQIILTLLIILVVSGLLGYVPYFWPLFIILFSLFSFYVFPLMAVDGKKIIDSFNKSFAIFKKYSLQTFAVYILLSIFTLALVIVAFAPIFIWLSGNISKLFSQGMTDRIALAQNLAQLLVSPTIIPFELIPAVLISFTSLMNIGINTRLYLNLKKRRR